MQHLWRLGYSAEDIIGNIFRVCKNLPIDEKLKLDMIKVNFFLCLSHDKGKLFFMSIV